MYILDTTGEGLAGVARGPGAGEEGPGHNPQGRCAVSSPSSTPVRPLQGHLGCGEVMWVR